MNEQNREYHSIDLMKFIMSFLVVAIHTDPFININTTMFYGVWQTVTSLAVPSFFVATGFLIEGKISKLKNTAGTKYIISYIMKLIKLYAIWNVVYLPLAVWNYKSHGVSLVHGIIEYLRGFFVYGEHYNSYILWYILSTIYALGFVLILRKLGCKKEIILAAGVVAMTFGVLITAYSQGNISINGNIGKLCELIVKIIINGRIFTGFLYIPLGMFLYEKKDGGTKLGVLVVIVVIMVIFRTVIEEVFLREALRLFATTALFLIVLQVKFDVQGTKYKRFRYCSKVIYFIHLWIWTILYMGLYQQKTYGLLMSLLTSIVSFIIAETSYKLSESKERSK